MITKSTLSHLLRNLRRGGSKAFCLTATSYKGAQSNGVTLICSGKMETICVASRGRNNGRGAITQNLEVCPVAGKTNCLTTVAKDNLILQRPRGRKGFTVCENKTPTITAYAWQENNLLMKTKQLNPSKESNNGQQPYQQNRIYDTNHKSPAHCANLTAGAYAIADENNLEDCEIRRLTPTECARLQTIPNWYKWKCSNTQQYKMLGNGWTVEVIKHILSFLPEELLKGQNDMKEDEIKQCCGNCALCIHTYVGSECGLTDNAVDDNQAACVDYIPED